MCVSETFGLGSLSVYSIGGLQSQGLLCRKAELILIYVEAVEIFSSRLMRDNFLLLFPRSQVRTMFYAYVQLTLIACDRQQPGSCVVVEK